MALRKRSRWCAGFFSTPSIRARRNRRQPRLDLRVIESEPFELFGREIIPIRLPHGDSSVLGYRVGNAAYLTDHNDIPEEAKNKLRNLDVLFLDALRHRPHPTHSTVARAVEFAQELAPHRAFFTHMSHDLGHAATNATLPANAQLSYDGLEIDVNDDIEVKDDIEVAN